MPASGLTRDAGFFDNVPDLSNTQNFNNPQNTIKNILTEDLNNLH